MARYSFWYSETNTMKGYFDAESLEEATELLRQANDGEIMFDDLPSFNDKCKGQDIEVAVDTLEAN